MGSDAYKSIIARKIGQLHISHCQYKQMAQMSTEQ